MTIRTLATELAKREGKRSQVAVGNMREIIGHLSDMVTDDAKVWDLLVANGIKRAKKKKKVKVSK